jgi:hypothetical protein
MPKTEGEKSDNKVVGLTHEEEYGMNGGQIRGIWRISA